MPGGRYLFIDGQYLESAYKEMMEDFFDLPGDIDVKNVVYGYQRTYYYHALEDELRNGEDHAAMETRIAKDTQRFEAIASISYVHVRLGSVSGRSVKRRRQKQVDVHLAVDMLSHGFNRSMDHAVLLTGDLDFKPVIDTLVSLGISTEVKFEKRSAARSLYRAADIASEITLSEAFHWSTAAFRLANTIPKVESNSGPEHEHRMKVQKRGDWNGRPLELLHDPNDGRYTINAPAIPGAYSLHASYTNLAKLELYFDRYHGAFKWT